MTDQGTQTQTQESRSGLEVLMEKYGAQQVEEARDETRKEVQVKFDKISRVGSQPSLGDSLGLGGKTIGDIQSEMDSIRTDLTDLAQQYGKLNVDFQNVIKERLYTFGDALGIGVNTALGRKGKVKIIRSEAVKRKGDAIEMLVNKMAEVLQEQYQRAVQGQSKAESLQVKNVSHIKYLDKELIKNLKGGKYTAKDMAEANVEVLKLENELSDIEKVLADYDVKMQEAKANSNLEGLTKLTDEASKVLDIKHGVLDGRISADGVVSQIRHEILDSAEGAEAARGAIAASKVNYRAISALVDSFGELEIKYRHAKDYMIPVFLMQGTISGMGMKAQELQKTLVELAGISNRLMESNAKLVTYVADETFNLLKTPIYDVQKAEAIETQIKDYMTQLNELKMEWAEKAQKLTESADQSKVHYAQPQ